MDGVEDIIIVALHTTLHKQTAISLSLLELGASIEIMFMMCYVTGIF